MVIVWAIGLAGLGFLALGNARLRSPGQGNGYVYGYALGSLAVGLAIGFGATLLFDRVRASSGRPKVSRIWAMPVAAVVLGSQLAGGAPIAASAQASNPPAQAYFHISQPYALTPTTGEDAAFVTAMTSTVGHAGYTDAKVGRIVDADQAVAGYLVVVSGDDLSGSIDAANAGMLDTLRERSISPAVTTVDGRSVTVFTSNQAWSASWFEGHFFVEVVAADKDSVATLAKAVLDAH